MMSVRNKVVMEVINNLCDELRKNPDGDMSEPIEELLLEMMTWEKIEIQHTLRSFFLKLYKQDVVSLKRDFCKVRVLGGKDANSNERVALLRCLYEALKFHYGDDFSDIMKMCDEIKEMQDLEQAEEVGNWH